MSEASEFSFRFNLVLCELHYTPIHGKSTSSDPIIEGHYILIDRFDGLTGMILDEDLEDEDLEDEDEDDETNLYQIQELSARFYTEEMRTLARRGAHNLIRNYHNIIRRPDYIKPEIAECIILPTGEHIAIIKTMWIKFIQRKWKNVYAARQHVIKYRCRPSSLFTRELTGRWPKKCFYMPGLIGMLSKLSNK